jgi:hypothetical protein
MTALEANEIMLDYFGYREYMRIRREQWLGPDLLKRDPRCPVRA